MARAAGDYDPHPADIYRPVTTVSSTYNREPRQARQLFGRTYIRFPWLARTDTEIVSQKQTRSVGEIIIRVRRNSKTIRIDPSMELDHDGMTYKIVGIHPIPSNERDELELIVRYLRPATLVTS